MRAMLVGSPPPLTRPFFTTMSPAGADSPSWLAALYGPKGELDKTGRQACPPGLLRHHFGQGGEITYPNKC